MPYSLAVSTSVYAGLPVVQQRVFPAEALGSAAFTTSTAGGFVQATVTFSPSLDPYEVTPNAHCALHWNGALCFEGMARRPHIQYGRLVSLEIVGYAQALLDTNPLDWGLFAVTNEPSLPMGSVLESALAGSLITVGALWGDPQGQVRQSSLAGRTPWQVAEQLSTATGYDLMVYGDRTATWQARIQPETPDYLLDITDIADYQPDWLDLTTRITATYTDPVTQVKGRTQQYPSFDAEREWGAIRAAVLDAGSVDEGYANAWAQQQLKLAAVPTLRATVGPVAALRDATGNAIEGPQVWSGQYVQIGTSAEPWGCWPIMSTSCDQKGFVTAQLGARALSPAANLARLGKAIAQVAAQTNLLSGGPA